jgi:hypothetical protein
LEYYFKEAEEKKFDIPPAPKRHKVFWFDYPDMETLLEGTLKIARSGIGIGLNVTGTYNATMCSRTLDEAEKRVKEKFFPPYSGYLVIAGISSERQMEYEAKVLKKIVEETGGKMWSEKYMSEQLEAVAPWNLEFIRNTVTGMRTVRSWYLATMITPYAGFEELPDTQEMWQEVIDKIGATTIFSTMGVECPYGYITDRGHQMETEVDQFVKRPDFKGMLMTLDSMMYGWVWFMKRGYPGNWMITVGEPYSSGSPEIGPNIYLFFRKLRKVFDPNNLMSSHKQVFTEKELEAELKEEKGGMATLQKWRKKLNY